MEQNDKKDLSYLRVIADKKKKIIHRRTLQKYTLSTVSVDWSNWYEVIITGRISVAEGDNFQEPGVTDK